LTRRTTLGQRSIWLAISVRTVQICAPTTRAARLENRARLMRTLPMRHFRVGSARRVPVVAKLSPRGRSHSDGDSTYRAPSSNVARPAGGGARLPSLFPGIHRSPTRLGAQAQSVVRARTIANEKFTYEPPSSALESGEADAGRSARLFIANPLSSTTYCAVRAPLNRGLQVRSSLSPAERRVTRLSEPCSQTLSRPDLRQQPRGA